MLDAIQAKEIAKTNFSALENDLELNNEYFKRISNMVAEQAKRSQTSVNIPYCENPRFNDIMTVWELSDKFNYDNSVSLAIANRIANNVNVKFIKDKV